MLKIVMIGVMLLGTLSCNSPTIKEPVKMYLINFDYEEAAVGERNLNYKTDVDTVGEWIKDPIFIPVDALPPQMMCFGLEKWLTLVKPKLKEGSLFYHDDD